MLETHDRFLKALVDKVAWQTRSRTEVGIRVVFVLEYN